MNNGFINFSSSVAQHSNGLRHYVKLEKLKFDGTILIDGDDGISPTKAINIDRRWMEKEKDKDAFDFRRVRRSDVISF